MCEDKIFLLLQTGGAAPWWKANEENIDYGMHPQHIEMDVTY